MQHYLRNEYTWFSKNPKGGPRCFFDQKMKDMYNIKENSWRARIAARIMKSGNMAIVFGNTIHIFGVSREQFLRDERWLKHELKHIEQYKKNGYAGFLIKYLVESLRRGYYKNRFEVEAREAEKM